MVAFYKGMAEKIADYSKMVTNPVTMEVEQ
jgi:hypothetical protein